MNMSTYRIVLFGLLVTTSLAGFRRSQEEPRPTYIDVKQQSITVATDERHNVRREMKRLVRGEHAEEKVPEAHEASDDEENSYSAPLGGLLPKKEINLLCWKSYLAENYPLLFKAWNGSETADVSMQKSFLHPAAKIGSKWVFMKTPDIEDFYIGKTLPGKYGGVTHKAKRKDGELFTVEKVVKTDKKLSKNFTAKLRREVRMMVQLEVAYRGDSIIEEVFEDEKNLWIVTGRYQDWRPMRDHVFRESSKNIRECYKIGKPLGVAGAFGKAYNANCLKTRKLFAAKKIDKSKYHCLTELRREVAIMIQVKGHPNIIEIEDVFEEEHYLWIVMEHCSGGELFDHRPKEESYQKEILKQMFSAVQYLHEKNVGHFDLKPDNVMYKDGDHKVIKLIDFGMAKYVAPGSYSTEQMGTAYYTAPEGAFEVDGETEPREIKYNIEADNWSMGIITYWCIFDGCVPFGQRYTDQEDNPKIYKLITEGFTPEVVPGYDEAGFPYNYSAVNPQNDQIIKSFIKKFGKNPQHNFHQAARAALKHSKFKDHVRHAIKQPEFRYHVSQKCQNFIAGLLTTDPNERMTAAGALEHPWLNAEIED